MFSKPNKGAKEYHVEKDLLRELEMLLMGRETHKKEAAFVDAGYERDINSLLGFIVQQLGLADLPNNKKIDFSKVITEQKIYVLDKTEEEMKSGAGVEVGPEEKREDAESELSEGKK